MNYILEQKSDTELLGALEKHLKILRDYIINVQNGNEEYITEIPNKLRLLVADDSCGGGLLERMVQKYPTKEKILWKGSQLSLFDFLNSGGINQTGRRHLIKEYAQSDGGSHESNPRKPNQFIIKALFDILKTKKTDLRRGLLIGWSCAIYDFGTKFLAEIRSSK